MIFTPESHRAAYEQHASRAKTREGASVSVVAADGRTRLAFSAGGLQMAGYLDDAEALTLADELRAAVAAKTALKVAA